jgi:hypothetical protein
VPGQRRIKYARCGAPELQPAARELDLERGAELLPDAPERATGRAAAELIGLEQENVSVPLSGQVISECTADDSAADDRRPDTFRSDVNLADRQSGTES